MKSLVTLLLTASLLFLTGCAQLGSLVSTERLDQVKVGLDIVHLDKEYQTTLDALMAIEWTEDELAQVRVHIAEFQRLKNGLEALADKQAAGAQLVVEAADTVAFLDNIAVHYNGLRNLYRGYIDRTGDPVNQQLRAYSNSGVSIWKTMYSYAKGGKGIEVQNLQKLLSYVAKGYLLHKTGGLSATF